MNKIKKFIKSIWTKFVNAWVAYENEGATPATDRDIYREFCEERKLYLRRVKALSVKPSRRRRGTRSDMFGRVRVLGTALNGDMLLYHEGAEYIIPRGIYGRKQLMKLIRAI